MQDGNMNELLEYRKKPKGLLSLYRHIKSLKQEESEELSKELCVDLKEKFDELQDILPVIRTYIDRKNPQGYRKEVYRSNKSKRNGWPSTGKEHTSGNNEKHIAMLFFRMSNPPECPQRVIPELGYILDYETPIGGNEDHLSKDGMSIMDPDDISSKYTPGNCDLLSYDAKKNLIYILELKDEDSSEPLLSAVVEAYTYLRLLDKDALRDNMKQLYPDIGIDNNTQFVAAPLIYKNNDNEQYKQLEGKNVRELIRLLGEYVFVYSGENGNYTVERMI